MLHAQLLKYTQYNLWANERIMDFIIKAGEEKADIICASSFPTIRKTVYHIYDAEWVWMLRLNHQQLEQWPPSRDFNFLLGEFKKTLLAKSQELINYVHNCTLEKLEDQLSYTNTKGIAFTNRIADVIMHVMNHGTYHRGQIITMLRTTGFTDVASTDYISFCR